MTKIKTFDSAESALHKLSEGNPGALVALMELVGQENFALVNCLKFDEMGIYGPRIWMLYKDIFRQRVAPFYFALKYNRLQRVIAKKKQVDSRFAEEWESYAA